MDLIFAAYCDQPPGGKSSSTFRNYTHSEPRFRALLTEGGAELFDFVRA
jgi:hypothetical protein